MDTKVDVLELFLKKISAQLLDTYLLMRFLPLHYSLFQCFDGCYFKERIQVRDIRLEGKGANIENYPQEGIFLLQLHVFLNFPPKKSHYSH